MRPKIPWKEKYPDKYKESYTKYNRKNRKRISEYAKKYHTERKVELRDKFRQKAYGISPIDYQALLLIQKNKCSICEGDFSKIVPHIDHCHKQRTVRGLLCAKCNTAIGLLNDDPQLCRMATLYLELV